MDICKPCNRKCIFKNCNTRSSFNTPGEKKSIFCKEHKNEGMIDVINKKCQYEGCFTIPVYNEPTKKNGIFCKKHKKEDMVDVINKKCQYEGCLIKPIYNTSNEKKGIFCFNHKKESMVNVMHKKCEYTGCKIISTYNKPSEKRGKFCVKHKEDDMVNITELKCIFENCNIRSSFNTPGEKKGIFCKEHKNEGMVDVINKKCQYGGCFTAPVYNEPGEKSGLFCVKHKENYMINVIDKKCEYNDCFTRAAFNIPGLKASFCSKHKQKGMIYNPTSRCKMCKKHAIYGINSIPTHCEEHKKENEKNLVERNCINCGLLFILDINDKCEYCNPESFKIVRLAKQNSLMEYLDSVDLKGNSTDIIIDNGICGKERPDRVYDFNDKILILECDEYQHREIPCECEQKRMINISQSFGGIPVFFIRWNPDNYISKNNKIIENVNNRYKMLGDYIKKIKNNKILLPNNLLSVLYMYYDDWDGLNNEHWKVIF